jgi:NAD+ synthase
MITNENAKPIVDRIVKFIDDKTESAGVKGVVIGLSGGIDSAVVTALATKVFSKEHIHCVYMPNCLMTNDPELEDARKIAKHLGLTLDIVPIGNAIDELMKSMFVKSVDNVTNGNIHARMRMIVLYIIANSKNYMVLGTGNKSELSIGYFTKYGDGGCDIEPIGDIYKTEVFEVAKYLGLPDFIVNKAPSAGLWPGQTDEGEIGMSYKDLDRILESMYIHPSNEVFSYPMKDIMLVQNKIRRSEHKRNMPETCKVDDIR